MHPARVLFVALLVGLGGFPTLDARADDAVVGDPVSERATHWSIGAGGTTAITGSDRNGSLLDAELYPGGRIGRLGLRLEARGLGQVIVSSVLAGLTFEAAASRPRLQLALYATAGASFDGEPLVAAGVQTQLWVIGPIALGLDTGGLLFVDGTAGTELRLGSALTLRIGR